MTLFCTVRSFTFSLVVLDAILLFGVEAEMRTLAPPPSKDYECANKDGFLELTFYVIAGIAGVITASALVILCLGQVGHCRGQREKKLKEAEDRAKGYTFTEAGTEAGGTTVSTMSTVGSQIKPVESNTNTKTVTPANTPAKSGTDVPTLSTAK